MPNGSVVDVTSIDGLILAIVTSVTAAVTYPVYDGPLTRKPARTITQFVVIGADNAELEEMDPPAEAATMQQEWHGQGQIARYETVLINCVAVGRGDTVANARTLAKSVVTDVGRNIGVHPTLTSYNALVSEVNAVRVKPTSGGAHVHMQFVISANARLT
jgi:hypothetical protein